MAPQANAPAVFDRSAKPQFIQVVRCG